MDSKRDRAKAKNFQTESQTTRIILVGRGRKTASEILAAISTLGNLLPLGSVTVGN